jgi:mono/diheme cytochrome c family protein
MSRAGRIVRRTLTALAALALFLILAIYFVSWRAFGRTYPFSDDAVAVPADAASIARGEHIFKALGPCATCHGPDAGGFVYADMGPVGVVAGPNLTRGRGGIGGTLTDADIVRALRYGVRRDGTSLVMMPSEVYTFMNDADTGAVIAYLRQVPPVDREIPPTRFGLLGRALFVFGQLDLLSAPKTHHPGKTAALAPVVSPEYGRYLASMSGCHGCHGPGLSGGNIPGPPDAPMPANLTPTALGSWTEADFVRAMREGRRPDGSAIDPFMPWQSYAAMTNDELSALWMYIGSVPAREYGNR